MSINDDDRAALIILKDFALFNRAAVFFEERVSPPIFNAIAQCVNRWLSENEWNGKYDPAWDLAYMQVNPAVWKRRGAKTAQAKFSLEMKQPIGNSYQLANLFGVGQTGFGFRFSPDHEQFGGKKNWSKMSSGLSTLGDKLVELGWEPEKDGMFFLPVELSLAVLVAAWEKQDFNQAFTPLTQALDKLAEDEPHFTALLKKAKSHPS